VGGYLSGRLIAASYLDVGATGVSSIYAFFDPEYAHRSLGTATVLWEIVVARRSAKRWYYPGYCYIEPSGYDYKRQFRPMQSYDWEAWKELLR
jgi:arginine-tRNA-protein transferase